MSETESKRNPASARKIEKQREEGNVAQATEIASMTASALSIAMLTGWMIFCFYLLASTFDVIALLTDAPFTLAYDTAIQAVGVKLALAVVPVAVFASVTAVLITLIYNKGPVFAMKPIVPDFKRISLGAGFKRLFGLRTWVEVGQSLVRLLIWFMAAGLIVGILFKSILTMDQCGEACAIHVALILFFRLIIVAILLLIVGAGIEALVQKFVFLHEQRMTDTEVKRETKEQLGSPELRKERNRLRQEAKESAGASSVDHANMCFYWKDTAIAVRYHPEHANVPKVTARARTVEKSRQLIDRVAGNGFKSLEHQGVVEAAFKVLPGTPMGEETHEQLIDALQKMFGNG